MDDEELYFTHQMTARIFRLENLCTRCTARIPRPVPIVMGAGGGNLGLDTITLAQVCDDCMDGYRTWFTSPATKVN